MLVYRQRASTIDYRAVDVINKLTKIAFGFVKLSGYTP